MGRHASLRSQRSSRQTDDLGLILSLSVAAPIGRIHLAASMRGLVHVELPGPNAELRMNLWLALHYPSAKRHVGVTPILKKTVRQLEAYFTSGLTEFSLPLDLDGTPFQLAVWRAVAAIPFGETRAYADIARSVERPKAVRAVGAAQGANPIPIIVPCHRVIGSDGSLTGYGGGLETKRWLLEHEAKLEARLVPAAGSRRPRDRGPRTQPSDTPPTLRPIRPQP